MRHSVDRTSTLSTATSWTSQAEDRPRAPELKVYTSTQPARASSSSTTYCRFESDLRTTDASASRRVFLVNGAASKQLSPPTSPSTSSSTSTCRSDRRRGRPVAAQRTGRLKASAPYQRSTSRHVDLNASSAHAPAPPIPFVSIYFQLWVMDRYVTLHKHRSSPRDRSSPHNFAHKSSEASSIPRRPGEQSTCVEVVQDELHNIVSSSTPVSTSVAVLMDFLRFLQPTHHVRVRKVGRIWVATDTRHRQILQRCAKTGVNEDPYDLNEDRSCGSGGRFQRSRKERRRRVRRGHGSCKTSPWTSAARRDRPRKEVPCRSRGRVLDGASANTPETRRAGTARVSKGSDRLHEAR
ncbi:hypothetical protein EXIGLDRAFT_842645 [Exidia glandulosa HHB12029]|uniref:Uncharacterized protein n=1 Tax=Exidia glandulosa HHB12029 TaxID=1314781 RepID=A0A165D5G8_EXIGL|nr:hypothetical protein EXIGLDRAFT_842645 [Exidia glandulosa HHB12029]